MPDNLILGLAAGYHFDDVRPFLRSLERTGFSGRLVLFVSDTTRDLERMSETGAEIIPFARSAELRDVPYNALRYFLYRDYLHGSGETYRRILFTDVRDVVFQSDPFAFNWPASVNAALEAPGALMGKCPHNSRWARNHLGAEALERMRDKTVSCSGTTVADHEGALDYLEAMTERLTPVPQGERMAGYVQAVHNLLVHADLLPNLALIDNDGPIYTLGQVEGAPELDSDGFVLNRLGRRPAIVHQYDRKPNLHRTLRRKYGPL